MNRNATIFVVDDVAFDRKFYNEVLSKDYQVEVFASAEECLARVQEKVPDVFLLDVNMPGVNGFDLCRTLRRQSVTVDVPVIFITGYDDIETRIESYDAGGSSLMSKPCNVAVLNKKLSVVLQWAHERTSLSNQVADSELLTSLILSNLDEYALLIRFLRNLNTCANQREISEALFSMLAAFRLDGIIQTRLGNEETTLGSSGTSSPIEVSIIQHVRGLDRIFSFGKRSAYNFEQIALLINNMPVEDAELCGRLRDHLAIAVESANARLQALLAQQHVIRSKEGINQLVNEVGSALEELTRRCAGARYQGAEVSQKLLDKLLNAFAAFGLSDQQEEGILDMVRQEVTTLVELYDFGDENQAALKGLLDQLSSMHTSERA